MIKATHTFTHELPDDIRVPLHSLQADLGYLFGRLAQDPDFAREMRISMENRLSQIETACYRLNEEALAE